MKREDERLLKSLGFRMVRSKKHNLWTNGHIMIAMSHGNKVAPRTRKSMISMLRRVQENKPITLVKGHRI